MGIDLEKRSEKVKISLEKRGIKKIPPVRVGLVVDTSGSAKPLFDNGVMQETVDRLLAVAMKFDDNGELDMWHFNDVCAQLDTATKSDYNSYIKKNINGRRDLWQGTMYSLPLRKVSDFYFPEVGSIKPEKKSFFGFGSKKEAAPVAATTDVPAMCFFITDGQTYDESECERILKAAQNKNIYWQMIGVGNPSYFGFLRKMADALPNVGFVNLNSLSMTDEELYSELICDEFCEWIKKF